MELIRGLYNLTPQARPCVATIGNFDGVHRGHAAIFTELNRLATQHRLPAMVISFQPLPHEHFTPETASLRLQTFRDRIDSIASFDIRYLLLLRFNQTLANQDASEFITGTLIDQLGIKHLLVGDDFRFGRKRTGDIKLLRQFSQTHDFSVSLTPTVEIDGSRVSSTRVRQLLSDSDCRAANALLGRPYRISGRVVKGAQIGRTLGFPTANIGLKRLKPLLRGVYAVNCIWNQKSYPAIANLGERPTVDGRKLLLEVHLLDESVQLYDECLAIDFLHHIRAEKKFDSLDELKAAIEQDALTARAFFTSTPSER